jgi:hypothetical protein
VIATYGRADTLSNVDEGWWLNEHTWRIKTLADHRRGTRGTDPNDSRAGYFTRARSFSVMAYRIERVYDAHDHSFFRKVDAERDAGPVDGLLEHLENVDYSPARSQATSGSPGARPTIAAAGATSSGSTPRPASR